MLLVAVDPVETELASGPDLVVFLAVTYLFGGWVLHRAYRRAEDPIIRQQIKWLRIGRACWAPRRSPSCTRSRTACWATIPNTYMDAAVLFFVLIPVTWAYAIVRYRLMDVDIIFQQGYVYTLATICVLAVFYGLIFWVGGLEDIGADRGGRADPDRGVRFPADPQVDPGTAGPLRTSTRTGTTTG